VNNYQNFLSLFLAHLSSYNQKLKNKAPRELYEPEEYILSLGGKRLRPLLALIACDLFNKDAKLALDSALTVELFHNFSLIHDDILDAAPLRRNQPTVHKKWNTNIAILSGDVMLVKAYQVLQNYKADDYQRLSALFTETAIEVCEGQQEDMNFEIVNTVTVSDYIAMITKKTAVLLGCSLQMGAINAGASPEDQEHIYKFGKHLGIAFQLMDDLLDAYPPDASKFGKQVGGDIISNKKTFLMLKAFETADPADKKTLLDQFENTDHSQKIKTVLDIYDKYGIKQLCLKEADKHTSTAIQNLESLKADDLKRDLLRNFANELLSRES
jgi:geranylgeranyl diphosphate synthase, type II